MFNIAKSIPLNNQVRNLPNHPGENSTYDLKFQGPQLRCNSVSHNYTSALNYNHTYASHHNDSEAPEELLVRAAPIFESVWDWEWKWGRDPPDSPLYSVAKHTPLTYTLRDFQNETSWEVLRTTSKLNYKPQTVRYDVQVSFPRGVQTVRYDTSDVKPLSPIGVYTDTVTNYFILGENQPQTVSMNLPADTHAVQDWNDRTRIIFSMYNEWTLLEALGSLLQDKIYISNLGWRLKSNDSWCNKSSSNAINETKSFDCFSWNLDTSSEMNSSCKSDV